MYFLDPAQGAARRALLRERVVCAYDAVKHAALEGPERDRALLGWTRRLFHRDSVSDEQLALRVRMVLTCVLAHPDEISVHASHGAVTLGGTASGDDIAKILRCAASTRGVRNVHMQIKSSQPSSTTKDHDAAPMH